MLTFSLKRQDSFEFLVLAYRDGSHRQRMESKQDRQQYHYNHHRQVLMWSLSQTSCRHAREIEAGRQTLVAVEERRTDLSGAEANLLHSNPHYYSHYCYDNQQRQQQQLSSQDCAV